MIHASVKAVLAASLLGALTAAGVLAPAQAQAQGCPAKPITVIVPFPSIQNGSLIPIPRSSARS